jgi:two-component system cell cycle sensor histidine kinase/response regulator CckA
VYRREEEDEIAVPQREHEQWLIPFWQRTGRIAAAATGAASLLALIRGAANINAAGILAAAAAILLLAPDPGPRRKRFRLLGQALAGALILSGASHWLFPATLPSLRPMAGLTALCFLALGLSLLLKPRLVTLAVTGDMLAAFVGLAVTLDYLMRSPEIHRPGAEFISLPLAVGIFFLAGAWLAMFPRLRPVSFFLERTSAGAVLRRLLPVTLLYPLLLVALATLRSHNHPLAAEIAQSAIIYGTVLFGAVLFWLIARLLDRRDAQAAAAGLDLRASEQRYRELFENNPQPMWIFDTGSLDFLAVNRAAERKYGYSEQEFLAMTLLDIRPAEEAAAVHVELAVGGDGSGRLWHHRAKDGRDIWAEIYSQRVDWRGRVARMSIVLDITDRIAAEAQVRTLMESTTEGIFAADAQGRCLWCNAAAAALLGVESPAQLRGRNIHALAHHNRAGGSPGGEEDCEMLLAMRAARGGGGDEDVFWRADGSSFYADWRSSPLRAAGGAGGAVVTFRDVTERRNLRQQFQQAQKMEAVGRLAAGIAHDFNNLLTVINGYTDLLLMRPAAGGAEDAQARTRVAGIRKAGERAAGLTKQLLAFSRQQVLEPRVLDLNAVVAEMEPLLRRILGEDLEFAAVLGEGLGTVRADAGQIGQVLMNLVVNARDAMPDGGKLTVETANVTLDERYAAEHAEVVPGEYVMLAVSDTGTGMDAATLSHIFEPFFTTKPVGQGTGLGLATVFGIAKQSGGSVGVYSEVGYGTTFKLYLPHSSDAAAAQASRSPAATGGSETVLLVEDEDTVRELIEEILTLHGYKVLVASGPEEARRLAQTHTAAIDLLISDVIMPGMGGRELAQAVREVRPGIPVLFVSGYPEQAISRSGAVEAGSFVQKPFTPDTLAAKVRAALDRQGKASAAAAASGTVQ